MERPWSNMCAGNLVVLLSKSFWIGGEDGAELPRELCGAGR